VTERGNTPVSDLPVPPVITMASRLSIGAGVGRLGSTPVTGTSPFAANDMLAFPFTLPSLTSIYRGFWINGSTVGNSISMAIYDADYNLLAQTASTGQATISAPQSAVMTAKLSPGLYYCAMAHDSATTNHFVRWSVLTFGAGIWKMLGCWRQASVTLGSLPNPATPVACNNVGFPVCGLLTRSDFNI
jgi:hypothetical protein